MLGGLEMKLPPQKLYPHGFGGAPQRLGGGGGGAGATRRVTEVVCVRPPPTPVIVRTMGADALPFRRDDRTRGAREVTRQEVAKRPLADETDSGRIFF